MKKIAFLFILFAFLFSCSDDSQVSSNEKKEIIPTIKEYNIDLLVKKIAKRKITISVKTNLPDGTKLFITVERNHWLKNKKDTYSGNIFSSDIEVVNGKINVDVDINDVNWYNEHLKLNQASPSDFPKIKSISNKIIISVLFSTYRDQKKEILEILGDDCQYISSKQMVEEYGMKTLNVSDTIKLKFKK